MLREGCRDSLIHAVVWMVLAHVCLASTTVMGSERRPQARSPEYQVMKIVGEIVHSIRNRDPAAISGYLGFVSAPGLKRLQRDEIARFTKEFRSVPGKPLVYAANPRVVWENGQPVVHCTLLWEAANAKGRIIRIKEAERFEFRKTGDRYVLSGVRAAPAVLRYLHDPQGYRKAMVRVQQAEYKSTGEARP